MAVDNKPRASFTEMENASPEEWQLIGKQGRQHQRTLPGRVISHLRLLEDDFGGFAVDRLTHSLQTATRAAEDGRDEEYVVCALLHDIGDTLGPSNHADIAAVILQPYVSEKNHWMVQKHAIFQGYYFFHHLGLDRDMRDQFKGHEYYDYTEEFCRKYDQNSFDQTYKTMALEDFVPALESVLSKPQRSILIAE
jgi:predicted HD phosphohydrolase